MEYLDSTGGFNYKKTAKTGAKIGIGLIFIYYIVIPLVIMGIIALIIWLAVRDNFTNKENMYNRNIYIPNKFNTYR